MKSVSNLTELWQWANLPFSKLSTSTDLICWSFTLFSDISPIEKLNGINFWLCLLVYFFPTSHFVFISLQAMLLRNNMQINLKRLSLRNSVVSLKTTKSWPFSIAKESGQGFKNLTRHTSNENANAAFYVVSLFEVGNNKWKQDVYVFTNIWWKYCRPYINLFTKLMVLFKVR